MGRNKYNFRINTNLKFVLLFVAQFATIQAQKLTPLDRTNKTIIIRKCADFQDHRNVTTNNLIIEIPGNLTDSDEPFTFRIGEHSSSFQCTNVTLRTVQFENDTFLQTGTKTKTKGERLRGSGKISSHFTEEGFFHEGGQFYDMDEYCLISLSESKIQLKTCENTDSKIIIPKCCGIDEILDYWHFTCRKVTQLEPKWVPNLHESSYPHSEISKTKEIRIRRQLLPCANFERWPLTTQTNDKTGIDKEISWKLLANARPVFMSKEGTWKPIPVGPYCVDGFANLLNGGNSTFTGSKNETVLLLCPTNTFDLKENETAIAIETSTESVLDIPVITVQKCVGFEDKRKNPENDLILNIPGNLTNSDETVDFRIDERPVYLQCSSKTLRTIKFEDGKLLTKVKSKQSGVRLRGSGKNSSHFTHEGYLHEKGQYYDTKEYCLKSVTDSLIRVETCDVSCHPENVCIPKCCGVDEVLDYWHFTCRKIKKNEPKWVPKLYHPEYPHDEISKKLSFKREHISCNLPERWPLTSQVGARNKSVLDEEIRWKLLPNMRPVYVGDSRQCVHIPEGSFCVDGFANWGYGGNGLYSGEVENHTVLLLCPTKTFGVEFSATKAWIYTLVLLFASCFLLLTALVHLLLLDKQHLHGLTVLCHSLSMFFMYIFFAIAHIVSLYPSLKGKPRSPFCMAVAVLSHYFFMTTFTWLTVMNFDLWLTFRSMRPVSKMSKRIRRFRLYFLIGWGLPAILSGSFYAVDEAYWGSGTMTCGDKKSEVTVPDYANKNCFVAIWSRGYYMYSLVAIALSVNTILIMSTFYIFYEFRKQNANTFLNRKTKSDKYSVRLFIKLFCVMGAAWFVELLSWRYNGDEKPWPVVFLDCVMFFQTFAIFFIFCINRRTLKQLEEKYPQLRRFIRPLQTYKWFKSPSDAAEGMEMTTPGSTQRKLSLSVTTHSRLDSTLPRKTSGGSTSLRSTNASSPVNPNGGIMEEINLDSECESETVKNGMSQAPDLLNNT